MYGMHPPPAWGGRGVKNFRKVFAGGRGQKFLFWWRGGVNVVGEMWGEFVEEVCTFLIFEPFIYIESKC